MSEIQTHQYDPLPIFAIAIGVVASSVNASGGFDLWDSMVGLILGVILLSFQDYVKGGALHRLSFSSLVGFCLILIFGFVGDKFIFHKVIALTSAQREVGFFLVWVLLTGGAYWKYRS